MEVATRAGHYIEFLRYIDVFFNEIYYGSVLRRFMPVLIKLKNDARLHA